MKLYINDETNSAKELYYQSLILLFLPCEKFGANDTQNSLYVKAKSVGGEYTAHVTIECDGKTTEHYESETVDSGKFSQMKNLIGRTLLKAAFKMFDIVPPWGISTGVKPVKLARIFVHAFGREEAIKILCDDYMIMPSKAQMAVDACLFEDKVMSGMGVNPCSLYVSIPFCPSKCNYCSFVSCTTPRLLSLIPDYLSALNRDLKTVSGIIKDNRLNLKSIYIGGGTPAILSDVQIAYLLDSIYGNFSTDGCEFTFEAGRPDCITKDKLSVLSDYRISRISINTQTTNDHVLKTVGRNHSYSDYVKSMNLARQFNFNCINTDLIAGLPGESEKSFIDSVKKVAQLEPENITIHAFTLKRSSNYRISGEKSYFISYKDAVSMTQTASEILNDKGYNPYYVYRQKNTVGNLENVGYSKNGFESIYNIIMMGEYHTVFGVGAGSVTKIISNDMENCSRVFSPKYPYEYLDREKYSGFDRESVIKLLNER